MNPQPAAVPENMWTEIEVPTLGTWEPERTVTVVVPYFERQRELDVTLAALAQQTYPLDLIEVVVVDDGSARPPTITDHAAPLSVEVIAQENLGYGLTRARNLGARKASGEILVFLDGDMIPERQHIEAHARWHHVVSDAAVIGFRRHADFSAYGAAAVASAVERGTIDDLVSEQVVLRPEWIERRLTSTGMLTEPGADLYRVMTGGNLSIRRAFYLDTGGNDESLDRYGGEDSEFGFRLVQAGAIVIPDRAAMCWHQGQGHEQSQEEKESRWLQLPLLDNLIAEQLWRRSRPGCTYAVPFAVVTVDARNRDAETTARTVESVLGSRFHDLVTIVIEPSQPDDAEWIRRRFRSDGRVHVADSPTFGDERYRFSPLRLDVPAGALFHPGTMDLILDETGASGVGGLYLTLPETSPEDGLVQAVTTRSHARALRLAESPDQIEPIIRDLFGERRAAGRDYGLGMIHGPDDTTEPELLTDEWTEEAKLRRGLAGAHATIDALRNRRSLRLAEALAQIGRTGWVGHLRETLRWTRTQG